MQRLLRSLLSLCLLWWLALGAQAGSIPFQQAAFDKAVAAGGPVVVYLHADWCPTCKQQAPIVAQLLAEPRMKDLRLFVADFDTETALKQALHVSAQSTFVVFKGGKEVARSTGQTSRDAIEATFAKAL